MIKIGTVCSGIGAPEKALRNLGIDYELAYFCEFDKFAAQSYCAIHSESDTKNLGDLTKIEIEKLPHDLDLLVGGTPCQDFSSVGLRRGGEIDSGTRSSLMWNFVAIIRQTQPKAVLWENVPGCLTNKMRPNYDKFCCALQEVGYKIHAKILNAKDFGIPQNRNRIFVLAVRKDILTNFKMPNGYDCGIRLKDVFESSVEKKYYLSDKQIENLMGQADKKRAKGLGFKFEPLDGKSIAHTVTCHETHNLECNWIQVSHGDCKGGLRKIDICPTITTSAFQENNFVIDFYNKSIRNNGLAGTITTGAATNGSGTFCVVKNNRIRKLTPKEVFRLMGFDDIDFDLCVKSGVSKAQLYKQAGNSIVVNVLMAIFGNLYGVDWKKKVYGNFYKTEKELLAELPLLNLQKRGKNQ